jgi:hypothetical protein
VVELALEHKLMVVINMHHYDEIFDDPDGHTERFLAIWDQISDEFKDYPDSLVFEILNEPHNELNQAKWNALFPIALDTIRKDNPTRKVIIGPPDWNGIGSVDKIDWPENDTNLIMTVHYYNPFEFTHQGASWVDGADAWLGTTWDSTAAQLQNVVNDFAKARTFSETKNVPVYVGEFGSYSTADMDSRKKWTACIARKIEEFGFSWAYWEFSSGFGVYDPGDGIWRNELLNALTGQTDPNSIPLEAWEVSNSEFSRGFLGWSLYAQGGAEASASVKNEEAVIDMPVVGDQSWHVQLVQTGIFLVQGAEYRFSFDARSASPLGTVNSSLSKNSDPFNSYSGSHEYTLSEDLQNYSFDFTMSELSDPGARVVFSISFVPTILYFDNIKLELLSLPTLVESITLGPDPAEIDTEEGSIQLTAEVLPEDASNSGISWEIDSGSSLASLSANGELTANGTADGTVVVRVSAKDESGVFDEINVAISNQTVGIEEISIDGISVKVIDQELEFIVEPSQDTRKVNLHSIQGKTVYSDELKAISRRGSISMSEFESNIYILEIIGQNSRKITKVLYSR